MDDAAAAVDPPSAGAAVDDPQDENDWNTPPRARGMPELHVDGYDGPLDVLLDLAERQRIDLGRISILALVEQFVAAMDLLAAPAPVREPVERAPAAGRWATGGPAPRVSIERRAEWLILATRLLLLRSRLLFPASPQAAAAAERDAAREVDRLEGMRLIRAAAAWLDARPQLGRDVFARPRRGRDPRVASYMAFMEAWLTVLRGRDSDLAVPEPAYVPARAKVFGVREALVRVRARLAGMTEPAPLQAFLPQIPEQVRNRDLLARSAVGSTFLAALELARVKEAHIQQDQPFGTIVVESAWPCP